MQLDEAVQLVAALGGYLGRKNDPPLGHQIMWRGMPIFSSYARGTCWVEV
jgi:hypothetical protein